MYVRKKEIGMERNENDSLDSTRGVRNFFYNLMICADTRSSIVYALKRELFFAKCWTGHCVCEWIRDEDVKSLKAAHIDSAQGKSFRWKFRLKAQLDPRLFYLLYTDMSLPETTSLHSGQWHLTKFHGNLQMSELKLISLSAAWKSEIIITLLRLHIAIYSWMKLSCCRFIQIVYF